MFQQIYGWCTQQNQPPRFVVIIPSYNNIKWYKKNLDSIVSQNHNNFHVIYIDDCSTDGTGDKVKQYITKHNLKNRITFIQNKQRHGALANLYHAIHNCNDNDIIVTVDGDDWLFDNQVLNKLNKVYSENNTWLTFGQFIEWPSNKIGHCRPIAKRTIAHHSYRTDPCYASHLRTFYAWLFKRIAHEDLLYKNNFFKMSWDWAFLYPMLEMAGTHAHFIPKILYVYNKNNPLSDYTKNADLQRELAWVIRNKKSYARL